MVVESRSLGNLCIESVRSLRILVCYGLVSTSVTVLYSHSCSCRLCGVAPLNRSTYAVVVLRSDVSVVQILDAVILEACLDASIVSSLSSCTYVPTALSSLS